ncbi:hypothetical protein [Roseibium sp. TrichSKD4]|uniref:hypothetical protein n=1 Tax=Roseibium sp. TrichSKD4 TaxID=744980 RepID=UPI00058CA5B9|nr:hypothetical protein [Roseibium sp. TrichSKD4]
MSSTSSTILPALRTERTPLVLLAALGIVVQVLVISLGLATSHANADAFGQLCEPSKMEGTSPSGGHADDACVCGPVCPHGVKLLPLPVHLSSAQDPKYISTDNFPNVCETETVYSLENKSIRAPPCVTP